MRLPERVLKICCERRCRSSSCGLLSVAREIRIQGVAAPCRRRAPRQPTRCTGFYRDVERAPAQPLTAIRQRQEQARREPLRRKLCCFPKLLPASPEQSVAERLPQFQSARTLAVRAPTAHLPIAARLCAKR